MSALRHNLLSGWPMHSCFITPQRASAVTKPACLRHAATLTTEYTAPHCQIVGHGCNNQAPRGALGGGRPAAAVLRHKDHMFARSLPHTALPTTHALPPLYILQNYKTRCRRRWRLPAGHT
jgi:hypothetical protein